MKKFLEKYTVLEPMVRPFLANPIDISQSQQPVKNPADTSSVSSPVISPTPIAEVSGVNIQEKMSYKFSSPVIPNKGTFYENTLTDSRVTGVSISSRDVTNTGSLENLFQSKHTIENLPPSEVQPTYMDPLVFQRSCGVKAFLDVVKEGGEVPDSLLAYGFTCGFGGHNLDKLQCVVPRVPALRGKHNFNKNLSEDILAALPPKEQEHTANMTLKEPLQITEYAALGKINPSQDIKIVHAKGENPDPRSLSGYFNLTPNKKPDFVSYLPEPVGVTTAVGFDFKYVLGRMPNKNIVKGCTINVEKHLVETHTELCAILEQNLVSSGLSKKDQGLANELRNKLENNLAEFKQNNDLNAAIYSYNNLRNEFGTFLIENKIGMTIIAHIDKNDFVINKSTHNAFLEKFIDNYTNPNSHLLEILNAHAEANFGTIPNENHCLTALAKTVFPDK